jgi:hypothetical protein
MGERIPQGDPDGHKEMEVVLKDGRTHYYSVEFDGWKVDANQRLLIIGHGPYRKHIPFENIDHFGLVPVNI